MDFSLLNWSALAGTCGGFVARLMLGICLMLYRYGPVEAHYQELMDNIRQPALSSKHKLALHYIRQGEAANDSGPPALGDRMLEEMRPKFTMCPWIIQVRILGREKLGIRHPQIPCQILFAALYQQLAGDN